MLRSRSVPSNRIQRSLCLETLEDRVVPAGNLTFEQELLDNFGGTEGLGGPISTVLSPDGNHVYALGQADDAVSVFTRDVTDGKLDFVELHTDGDNGVDGLNGASFVAMSPDGNHVYVTGSFDDALAVFSRNATTGELTFVEAVFDNVNGVNGLDDARTVAVSPDGSHVYATGFLDDAVAVFARNDTTGELTFVETIVNGPPGNQDPRLNGAFGVTVSPDGETVYVTASNDHAVNVFSRDDTTGELTFTEVIIDQDAGFGTAGVDGILGATDVIVSDNGANVYVTGGGNKHALVVFDRALDGTLTFSESHKDGVNGVDGLEGISSAFISPDGEHVYTTSLTDDALALFERALDGTLTFVEFLQDNVNGVDGLGLARSVRVSPDGEHVYAVGFQDGLPLFDRDTNTGSLTFVELQENGFARIEGLDGAFDVAVSPDGNHIYTVSKNSDNSVSAFVRNPDGSLEIVQTIRDGINGVDGLAGGSGVVVSPDGNHVYISASGDNSLSVYSRDAGTGLLTFVQQLRDGINGIDNLRAPGDVKISSDGKHVYVTATNDHAVSVYNRNLASGELTFVESHVDGTNGVNGIRLAWKLAISPDDKHVYASGPGDSGVAVFSRDATTGALTFVEAQLEGVNGVDGLSLSRDVAVSPDGTHVYALGEGDDAVVVFSRNATTGQLTFVGAVKDTVNGVDGINAPQDITISSDGNDVYVTAGIGLGGGAEHSLAVFSRDGTTGMLTFVDQFQDDVDGIDNLGLPKGL